MNQITLKNYRCFADEQTARLAPLTILIGENSTGKTSFLALIRALGNVARGIELPDFKEPPYDLGSFDEITHHRGGRAGRADTFEAGLRISASPQTQMNAQRYLGNSNTLNVVFGRRGTTPVPVETYSANGDIWIQKTFAEGRPDVFRFGTRRGQWELRISDEASKKIETRTISLPFSYFWALRTLGSGKSGYSKFVPIEGSRAFNSEDQEHLSEFDFSLRHITPGTFASAPVRSKPRRTYDPSRPIADPEGEYVPMFLADLSFRDRNKWQSLKRSLEDFGRSASLFDEITIRPLGKRDSEPFQIQVRKFSGKQKGPPRNLIDVGYGVSQVLPLVTDLLREGTADLFLLQQPEVHLHPSAQAALGSLFCQVAAEGRQLIIETHSDYILDRVRMDVRDGVCGLKPEDVSILFFERQGLGVQIHSIRLDNEGNVLDAPPGYGNFFINETTRSLGL